MQSNGARLEFDRTLWAHWHHVHAWVDSGRMVLEPVNDRARVAVYDAWGRELARYGFIKGQWQHVETGAAPDALDESLAGRVTPAHEVVSSPALALAAQMYRARRPIRTPMVPGDESLPPEDSAIVQGLIRGAIAVFFAGWLVVWFAWVTYVVWKLYTRIHTGTWPKLTLHDVGFHYHSDWPVLQHVVYHVLHMGLGWTFLLVGTAVYVLAGGFVLFLLFMVIKLVEAAIRAVYLMATAGSQHTP